MERKKKTLKMSVLGPSLFKDWLLMTSLNGSLISLVLSFPELSIPGCQFGLEIKLVIWEPSGKSCLLLALLVPVIIGKSLWILMLTNK